MAENNGIKLNCKNCDHTWTYTGDSDHYTTCPNCLYKVNVKKRQV